MCQASSKWRIAIVSASISSRSARNAASLQTAARSAPVSGRVLHMDIKTHTSRCVANMSTYLINALLVKY